MFPKDPPSSFRPHGDTQARFDAGLLQVVVTGPFNLEGLRLLGDRMVAGYAGLAPGTPVVNVCEMRGTLVYTTEAWEEMGNAIQRTSRSGPRVVATAWIVAPEVEGGRLLLPKARALFAQHGRRFEVFALRADAERWARQLLSSPPPE